MNLRSKSPSLDKVEFLGSPQFVNALTAAAIGTAASSYAIVELMGWPGMVAILTTEVLLAVASAFVRRDQLDWTGILPISLIAFLGWCITSVIWSEYQWATLSSVMYQFAFAALAVYIGVTRDMIQIVRAFGNVLRFILGLSLALEVFSGILLDGPIRQLGIEGDITLGGPIQGITGDATHLGILALIGGITFAVELVTRSVTRPRAIVSLVGAAFIIVFTTSNIIMTVGGALVVAAFILVGIRRVRPAARPAITWTLLSLGAAFLVFVLAFGERILDSLRANDQLQGRLGLWREVVQFLQINNLEGWGWIGNWRTELAPFLVFRQVRGEDYASAFNSFLDVWFQVGLVGLVIFIVLVGLTLVRSWHLAVRQLSIVYIWPALVLMALVATAITESALLVEFGWLTLVICVVKSSNKMSWRLAFERIRPTSDLPSRPGT